MFIGVASALACLFSLSDLIKVLVAVQAIFQFAAQCVAVELMRRRGSECSDVYRMPLYPIPALVALLGWIYIAASSGPRFVAIGLGMVVAGGGIYLLKARHEREWPFAVL